jgi:hypothetical protein
VNVGASSVQRAKDVIDRGAPELVAAVEAGEVPVSIAAELATALPRDEQAAVVRERNVIGRAKEIREQRRTPTPRPPQTPPAATTASPAPPARAPANRATQAPQPPLDPPHIGPALQELPVTLLDEMGDDEAEESTLDPANRPDPQPIQLTAFKSDYRRGTNPKEEAPKVDQILAAARTALHAWRWIVIEWNEDKRWDMKFAIHESGQIAMHLQQAVARLEEISAICNGQKPAPPSERP